MKKTGTRKCIVGGCRKCRTDPAENHGRGLCGVCYGEEYDAGRIVNWPKVKACELYAAPAEEPLGDLFDRSAALPPGEVVASVNVTFEGEDLRIFDHLVAEAKEQRRTLDQHVLWYLDSFFTLKPRTAAGAAAGPVGHA